MPEYLRTFAIILVFATAVFSLARAPACALAFNPDEFVRRRNLWFLITSVAFLSNNFWIYIVVVAVLLYFAVKKEANKLALYFLVLFAVPPYRVEIDGLGVINFLFAMDYLRLLALMVLLPAYLSLRRQQSTEKFGRNLADKMLLAYLVLQAGLILPTNTFTNTIRLGVFYPFVDVFLPYYVASRSLRSLQDFRAALMAFAIAAMVLSAIGIFEFARHWLMYHPLEDALGIRSKIGSYLGRGDDLRAVASTGQPIVLGYSITVAIGFFLFLKRSVPDARRWALGMALLCVGLISPLSRGPWIGAAAMVLLVLLTGPHPLRRITRLIPYAILIVPIVLATPIGDKVIDYLPWIGTSETKTVDFREELFERSVMVIMQNPFFGTYDYLSAPELQALATNTGLIDIVNSYVGIALAQGVVPLFFFVGVFAVVIFRIFLSIPRLPDRESELHLLGQILLAVLVGILVMIGTVSSILVVPVVYWSVAGLGVAYLRLLDNDFAKGRNQADLEAMPK